MVRNEAMLRFNLQVGPMCPTQLLLFYWRDPESPPGPE
jgi:hypothetical protein